MTGGLRLLALGRSEKRNALTRPLLVELIAELERVGSDLDVRGVILAGDGPSFCAGVDLHEFSEGDPETGLQLISLLRDLCATVRRLPKPVAVAIQGHCLGGALELAACCDFRVCAPDAELGMPEVHLGLPSVIDAVMLERHLGISRAHELLLVGDPISGQTAFDWGFANRLAAAGDLVATAVTLLGLVTRHDPAVIAAQKRLHQDWLNTPYDVAVEASMQSLVDAFREGRPQRIAAARLRR